MASEMRQLYIQHGRNYINIIKSWCPRDEKVYYIICPAICTVCTVCTAKQPSNEPESETTQHVDLCTCNTYWANSANDRSLTIKLRRPKTVTASFSIAFQNLSMKPEELGLSLLSQSLTFGHDKHRIIFILPTPHLCCQHQLKVQISLPPHSLHVRPPCTIR